MTRKRRDLHHAEIRDGLRRAGYFVADLADCGNGIPDLLVVSKTRIAVLIEVKTKGEDFTQDEKEFWLNYPGPHVMVYDLEAAIRNMEYYDDYEIE